MIRIMRHLRVDSVGTSTWRVKATYGHVMVLGVGGRYVGERRIRYCTPRISEDELELPYKPLSKTGFPLISKLYELLKTFGGRVLINAWVITKVDGDISPKSTFSKLLTKLLTIKNMKLEDIMKIYDGYMRV